MVCGYPVPVYRPHSNPGIKLANSNGDGYSIGLDWNRAFVSDSNYRLGYNIYFSSDRTAVFSEHVKYVVTDSTKKTITLYDFVPGETYYFAVRAFQYLPDWYNINLLPNSYISAELKIYPETILTSDMTDTDLVVNLSDITGFPASGIIIIGTELIRYSSKDIPNNQLIVSDIAHRGYLGTNVRLHLVDGYDGVIYQDPVIRFWEGLEEKNEVVNQETNIFAYPNYAYTLNDGYKKVTEDVLTTDLSSTEQNNIDFPKYDYAGWHRTDLKLLANGGCVGSYIGGEFYCADGYEGVGRQIRNVSMNDMIYQREEILLENTGELCLLLRRQRTGIRCSCFMPNSEHPQFRCPKCFVKGTLVRTEQGYRPIEEIKVGEKVLTAGGTYNQVTEVHVRPYEGELIGINTSISANTIFTTPEHPFLAMRGEHYNNISRNCGPKCNIFIKNDSINNRPYDVRQLPCGNWHARITFNKKRMALGSYSTKEGAINTIIEFRKNNFKKDHEVKWDEAKNIFKNDWLVSRWNKDIKDIEIITVPEEFRKNTKRGEIRLGVNSFNVDEEFLWVLGLYIAEGSCSKRSMHFALHKKEVEYQSRVINYFTKLGYRPKVRDISENGVVVEVNSTTLAQWWPKWVGKHCYAKKIPEELMQLPKHKIWALINGIYDGDGSKSDHEIGQTSEILALQLVELLHRVGEQPLLRSQVHTTLTPRGNQRRKCYVVSWKEDTANHVNRRGRWKFEGDILTKVSNTTSLSYCGNVYNLEVDGDHSYIVQGIVVHNCLGTGIVMGYQQVFNPRRSDGRLFIRFSPTADDLKLEAAGLESDFPVECWTLGVPIIKDRDCFIRYDENGLREFMYEVLDVTRNKLIGSTYGAQKFKAQRIRKTDKHYQIKVIDSTANLPAELTTSIGFIRGINGTLIPHTHTVKINENIVTIAQISQITSISQDHSHEVIDGIIQEAVGHSHVLVL